MSSDRRVYSSDRQVYIDSDSGNDDGPGTRLRPFATLVRALAEQPTWSIGRLLIEDVHPTGSRLVLPGSTIGNVHIFGKLVDIGPSVGLPILGERRVEDVVVYVRDEKIPFADLTNEDTFGIAIADAGLPQFDPRTVSCWAHFLTGRAAGVIPSVIGSGPGVLDVMFNWGLYTPPSRGDSFMIVTSGTQIEVTGEVRIMSWISVGFHGIRFIVKRGYINIGG